MRISDWSSDVCSSDLEFLPLVIGIGVEPVVVVEFLARGGDIAVGGDEIVALDQRLGHDVARRNLIGGLAVIAIVGAMLEIGRARVGKGCGRRCRSRWSAYH